MKESSILRISEAAALALHTVTLLAAQPEKQLPSAEIASRLGASGTDLSEVLRRLAEADIVESATGREGEVKLARPCNAITLLDVYESMEGKLPRSRCLMSRRVCGGRYCILGGLFETVDTWVRIYLSGTRLSQLTHLYAGDGERGPDTGKAP